VNAASNRFDLVVIGGGSGGLAAAFRAASHGARVALCEPGSLGGTCVNVGCVPKKAMWLAADLAQRLRLAASLGFDVPPPALDWPTFLAHRQGYIDGIHAAYRSRLDANGIVVLPTRARLRDARSVVCDSGEVLQAERVLVATGGRPRRPDVPGAGLGGVSDDVFGWTAPPQRLAIVGGGYVAVEFAGVLQALGSRVELFVRGSRLLDGFDAELSARLAEDYRQSGMRLHFDHRLAEVQPADHQGVRLFEASGAASDRFDALVFATGRVPNSDDLGLDALGVARDERGRIRVDAFNATNVDGVFAVGDVTTDPALTPVAIAAARRAMDRAFGGDARPLDRDLVPTVVFSKPPLARIGLDEAEARMRHGDAVRVYRADFRPMLHALADSSRRNLFKLVCVGDDRRVVGLHMLGEAVDEILQGFAVAVKLGATLDDLHDTVAIHPTSAEEVVLMR
jgi:glutathione reductase (NADPH)